MRVTVRCLHLDDAFSDFENGDIKRASAEVVNGDSFVFLFIQTVGESGGRRLIDDAKNFEAGDSAGIFRRLALRVIEIGRDRDHRFLDLLSKIVLGGRFFFNDTPPTEIYTLSLHDALDQIAAL